jgi:hypothetical protein
MPRDPGEESRRCLEPLISRSGAGRSAAGEGSASPTPGASEPADKVGRMADLPQATAETLIVDLDGHSLLLITAALWPPVGAIVELRDPPRDAVVREVRLRHFPNHAAIEVKVDDPLTHPL